MKYKVGQVFDYKYANQRGHKFKIAIAKVYKDGVDFKGERAERYLGTCSISFIYLRDDFIFNVIETAKSLRKLSKK